MAHQILSHSLSSFRILLYISLLAFCDSLRCYSFPSFFASDYNYDDPGDIQRRLERLNKIMNQPDWNPNDPNKKMYLSQCKCTYATRPFVFIVPFSRSVRLFAIDFPSMTFD